MTTVAIIGAGPLGRWLALSAARAGFRVLLEDVMPANLHHAQEYIRQQLGPARPIEPSRESDGLNASPSTPVAGATSAQDDSFVGGAERSVKGTGFSPYIGHTESERAFVTEVRSPVTFVSTIEDAVREADLAIDCVPDELESKLEILWLLDRMAPPRTVLATPTTRLSIANLANCTYRPEKCIAIAVEASALAAGSAPEILLRTTRRTSPETVALVRCFWQELGFTPTFTSDPAKPPAS